MVTTSRVTSSWRLPSGWSCEVQRSGLLSSTPRREVEELVDPPQLSLPRDQVQLTGAEASDQCARIDGSFDAVKHQHILGMQGSRQAGSRQAVLDVLARNGSTVDDGIKTNRQASPVC